MIELDPQRRRQVEKYRGSQCFVCGKWGASERFGEPVAALIDQCWTLGITLKRIDLATCHDRCLDRCKSLVRIRSANP